MDGSSPSVQQQCEGRGVEMSAARWLSFLVGGVGRGGREEARAAEWLVMVVCEKRETYVYK